MKILPALILALGLAALSHGAAFSQTEDPGEARYPDSFQAPYWLKRGYTGGTLYLRQNHDYYPAMLADLRAPVNAIRYYRAEPVPYTQSSRLSLHNFGDVTFGESFHLFGWDYSGPPQTATPRFVRGWAAYIDGSAHMLLDVNTASRDVVNTDYRIGIGLAGRGLPGGAPPSWDRHFSWKAKYFHESTHLGDEFSIAAEQRLLSGDPAYANFRRINVSYEAAELYLAWDGWRPRNRPGIEYRRIYAGYRHVNEPGFETDDPPPLPADIKNHEAQFGAELYYRWSPTTGLNPFVFRGLPPPQFIVFATDAYKRDQYDFYAAIRHPAQWSFNTLAGAVYGDPFLGENTVRYSVNYYAGLNPHGQFRSTRLNYLGFTISLDFK